MTGLLIRIFLRYLAAALITRGVLSADAADYAYDPDVVEGVEIFLGAAIGVAVEAWYWLARRFGWER